MKGLALSMTVLLFASAVAVADKPNPIFTPENFTNNMRLLGRNFGGINASLARGDFETAKAQLARSRELLAATVTYWRDRNNNEALKMLRDTLNSMDDLDSALSAQKVDPPAVIAIANRVGAGCESCHSRYREQDPTSKSYRFKN